MPVTLRYREWNLCEDSQASGMGFLCRGKPRVHNTPHLRLLSIVEMVSRKGDVEHAILALSTYLGHTAIACTYWHLTRIPELLAILRRAVPEVSQAKQGGQL